MGKWRQSPFWLRVFTLLFVAGLLIAPLNSSPTKVKADEADYLINLDSENTPIPSDSLAVTPTPTVDIPLSTATIPFEPTEVPTFSPTPFDPTPVETATATPDPSLLLADSLMTINDLPPVGSAGYALNFDGANDMVSLAPTLQMIGPDWKTTKSVSLWIKPLGNGQACLYNDAAFCDVILGDLPRFWGITRGVRSPQSGQPAIDRIWIWNFDSWTTGADSIGIPYTAGEWMNIAVVHSGGVMTVYINGVTYPQWSFSTGATLAPDNPDQQPILHLGGVINSSTRVTTFEGVVDEVRIFSNALSQTDIQNFLLAELAGNEPGLRAYYKMSDGSGPSLTDDSGHGWTGTLKDGNTSAPADGHVPEWISSSAFDSMPPLPPSPTPGATSTVSNTPTRTPIPTATATPTSTSTGNPTATSTPAATLTPTATSIPTLPPTNGGYWLYFDGANDYVQLPNSGSVIGANWSSTKTFSLWIKPEGTSPVCLNSVVSFCDIVFGDTLRRWGISRGIRSPQSGQPAVDRLWIFNQDTTDSSFNNRAVGIPYGIGQWIHLAVVQVNGVLTVYVNGETNAGWQTASGATQGSPGNLVIGGVVTSNRINTFEGELDEVRIYSISQTQASIQNTLFTELAGNEPGLQAYYKMSDGSGLSLTDDSGHGWTGTLKDGNTYSLPDGHAPEWQSATAITIQLVSPGQYLYLPVTLVP